MGACLGSYSQFEVGKLKIFVSEFGEKKLKSVGVHLQLENGENDVHLLASHFLYNMKC